MTWLLATALAADVHQERFLAARDAETALAFDDAVLRCREAIAADATGPRTPTCERRIGYLEARRDPDGTFGGWTTLESVRRRYRTDDPAALAAEVEALAARPLSPATRAEVASWLARDALARRRDPAAALAALEGVEITGEEAVDRQLDGLRAAALAELGRTTLAHRRGRLARAALGALGVYAVAVVPLAVVGWRRARPVPLGLVPLALAALGAALIAGRWEEGAGAGVPALFVGAVVLHLLTLGALVGAGDRPFTRGAVRALAAVATVAVGYLALWWSATLDWVGL